MSARSDKKNFVFVEYKQKYPKKFVRRYTYNQVNFLYNRNGEKKKNRDKPGFSKAVYFKI